MYFRGKAMGIANKLWDFLGSRNLSVFIFIMGLTYVLFLVAFSFFVPAWWVTNISKLLPFKILYILFFINLLICEIKWIPVIVRRCRRPKMPETEEDWHRFGHKTVVSTLKGINGQWPVVSSRLEGYLRRRGYKIQWSGTSTLKSINGQGSENPSLLAPRSSLLLHAYRGRFSPIGNLLFHISFLFLLAGVFAGMFYRSEAKVLLMEGQESSGSGLNVPSFEVMDIRPGFWNEKLLFTELVARLKYEGKEKEARLSRAAYIDGAKVTIEGISYTPKYILKEMGGRELDVGYVNLANFVPGSVDHFQIPGYPYKIFVSVYPDFEFSGGIKTRSMNLINPRFMIKVVRSKVPVYSGILGFREEASFDGLSLSFPEIKYNGTFRIIRDPGNIFIWAGFILMGIGLVWKMLFYKREIIVVHGYSPHGGKVSLCTHSDYYPGLFLKRCAAIVETGL